MNEFSVVEIARGLSAGSMSAMDVLDGCLEQLERVNPGINAVVTVNPGARAEARASEERHRVGASLGPLDGVPITVKDNLLVGGLRATWGTRLFEDHIASHDELPVETLRRAGAVIVGKTNVSEFTVGGFTNNPIFGATLNPLNTALTPGGSSGGAVASVAAGIVPLALATDGGGSIRRPAAHTGLVGFKPSSGRVARGAGFPVIFGDFEVVGPIAATVADVILAMEVLGQPDIRDPRSRLFSPWRLGSEDARPLPGLRILAVEQIGDAPVEPAIRSSFREAQAALAELGHLVEPGCLPFDIDSTGAWSEELVARGLARLASEYPGFASLVSPRFAEQAQRGAALRDITSSGLDESIAAFRGQVSAAYRSFDVILMPATAAQPWPVEFEYPAAIDGIPVGPRGHAVFTGWVNAAGNPAVSIPIGWDATGLPIGAQLIGPIGSDEVALALALELEATLRRSPITNSPLTIQERTGGPRASHPR
ncbi:amidase [Lacisediminihabitans profunda]|uniref:Amidase n=1 Tax=Lacisediminihabitans profunda TaxID=2594790 RepID=A0A5C8UM12_9MICO|nr:amidase [Lacisediminihabitans profunda]TXN28914.1 amidase [Lacisediminihabitans profunda]